jgi:serine phosphatase RsbU (regulator of sigma subunit)
VYTDGIVEALSPQHEQFGLERLLAVIQNREATLEDLITRVRSALQQHQAGMPRTDDQALLVFEIASP